MCYKELFGFELVTRAGSEQKGGLETGVARQYQVCRDVYRQANALKGIGYNYCFDSLAKCIELLVKQMTMSVTEANMLDIDTECGVRYEHEQRAKEKILQKIHEPTWEFDCPICKGQSTMLAELDEQQLRNRRVSVRWCHCVSCGMWVPHGSPFLADQLLRVPIEVQSKMMSEFGIW
jgi:hypothetical protein